MTTAETPATRTELRAYRAVHLASLTSQQARWNVSFRNSRTKLRWRHDRDDIALLYEYDRWTNNRVLDAASALAPEQFTEDLGGSFSSVRDTLVHILAGEWVWLNLWKQPSPDPEFLSNLRTRRETVYIPAAFPDFASVKSKWTEIAQEQTDLVSGLTDADLDRMVPSRGGELSLARLMQHLANHSTYHRGQISLMMRQVQAQPASTDFHLFLTERRDAHS